MQPALKNKFNILKNNGNNGNNEKNENNEKNGNNENNDYYNTCLHCH